jgi:hypothetical protein
MMDDSEHPGARARLSIGHWLGTVDLVLAVGTVAVAAIWIWRQDREAAVAMGALLLPLVLLTAAAFVLAHRALRRSWSYQWLWQIPGPAMLVLMLFGTAWAIGSALVAALAGWLVLRSRASAAARSEH